jgi:hypothetical protein
MSVCCEGDDTPDDGAAIRVNMYGDQFCAVADGGCWDDISATGPNALATLAMHLSLHGFVPDQELVLFRGGERVGKTTVGEASIFNRGDNS